MVCSMALAAYVTEDGQRGEALGPVKAQCPSVREYQEMRWEWVCVWASTLELTFTHKYAHAKDTCSHTILASY